MNKAFFRNSLIGDFTGGEGLLAGRVVGILDSENTGLPLANGFSSERAGFILQDQSGRITVFLNEPVFPDVGSILSVPVGFLENGACELIGDWKVLAVCEDFFIAPRSSPNYQKMLIDLNLREKLILRAQIIAGIREYFVGEGFLETDTPEMVRLPGMEPYLDVFKTKFEADLAADQKLSEEMFLITSPEYAMKKLLVGGMEKIFQVTKAFRNKETFSDRHNPEFTILEWYRAYASYLEIMEDTEGLVKFLWRKFGESFEDGSFGAVKYKGFEVDVMKPWRKLSVVEAFNEYAGVSEVQFFDEGGLVKVALEKGYKLQAEATFDEAFFVIFMNEIEPKLGFDVPVILYEYPVSMAALSKRSERDGRVAERFEVYIAGLELCNAFTELNDAEEQERRLNLEKTERAALGKESYEVDMTFIKALKFGMPPSGGNALGVDRLIMLMLGEDDIRNVLFFPHRDL